MVGSDSCHRMQADGSFHRSDTSTGSRSVSLTLTSRSDLRLAGCLPGIYGCAQEIRQRHRRSCFDWTYGLYQDVVRAFVIFVLLFSPYTLL